MHDGDYFVPVRSGGSRDAYPRTAMPTRIDKDAPTEEQIECARGLRLKQVKTVYDRFATVKVYPANHLEAPDDRLTAELRARILKNHAFYERRGIEFEHLTVFDQV